jgi:hypothetical protein
VSTNGSGGVEEGGGGPALIITTPACQPTGVASAEVWRRLPSEVIGRIGSYLFFPLLVR